MICWIFLFIKKIFEFLRKFKGFDKFISKLEAKTEKNKEKVLGSVRLLDADTPFAVREAFNQLRTNIMYSAHDSEGAPVYAITSAAQGVGKSTVSANVALSFSQAGQKVLLIGADMRCPTQYKFFGYEKKQPGFSELLSGIVKEPASAISAYSDNLHIITSGCIPPNPSALLMSNKLSTLVKQWKKTTTNLIYNTFILYENFDFCFQQFA